MENCPVRNIIYIPDDGLPGIKIELEDLQKINNIIDKHKNRQGVLMPVLQEIMVTFNYLPEFVLRYISQRLDVPVTHIYRLATFYNAFSLKPRGRHTIRVCMGTTCYVRGGSRILDRLTQELGIPPEETTEDLKFTLSSVRCLGCCGLAPAIMIDDKVYGKVRPSEIHHILNQYE